MIRIYKHDYPLKNILLIIGESISIWASIAISYVFLLNINTHTLDAWGVFKIVVITLICQLCLFCNELYNMQIVRSINELGIRLCRSLGGSAILLAVLYIIVPGLMIRTKTFALSIPFIIILIVSWRFIYNVISNHGILKKNIIILGSSPLAEEILDKVNSKRDYGYTVSMIIPEHTKHGETIKRKYPDIKIHHDLSDLNEITKQLKIKKIIIALEEKRKNFPIRELLDCRVAGIDIIDGNSFYETLCGKILVENINPGWLIFSDGFHKSVIKRTLKRLSDIVLSSIMIFLLSPLIGIISLIIKLDSKGPVLFKQDRVGERKKVFQIIKFRSMIDEAEKISGPVWAEENDSRVTRVGKYLRKFRLDEIPQLWNVFKGEMSFAGPRPERECFVNELEKAIPYYSERFTVKPGVTGWAQISYGYGASIEDAVEKLNYDIFYIKNMTLFMDLMITIRTVKTVLFGKTGR